MSHSLLNCCEHSENESPSGLRPNTAHKCIVEDYAHQLNVDITMTTAEVLIAIRKWEKQLTSDSRIAEVIDPVQAHEAASKIRAVVARLHDKVLNEIYETVS